MTNDTAILSIAPLPENIPAPVSEYYYYNGHFSEKQTSFKQFSPLFLVFSLILKIHKKFTKVALLIFNIECYYKINSFKKAA